jgi:hypothetical protein
MGIFNFLRSDKLDVEKLMKHIGQRDFYIMNGYGYKDVNKPELFDNRRIEVAIGRTTSGLGDWGGGFDRITTCPITIVIDEHFNIITIKYDDFYNSDSSKEVRRKCEKWVGKNKFKTLKVRETSNLYEEISKVITKLGMKERIAIDGKYISDRSIKTITSYS